MCKIINEKVWIILIQVDDLLVIATKGEVEKLKAMLKARFGEIIVNEGHEISYLGMQIMIDEMTFFCAKPVKGEESEHGKISRNKEHVYC